MESSPHRRAREDACYERARRADERDRLADERDRLAAVRDEAADRRDRTAGSPDFLYLTMPYPGADGALEAVARIVRQHGPVCYDPLTETLLQL